MCNENFKLIKISDEIYENKKILCFGELYKEINVLEPNQYIENYRANNYTINKLEDYLKNNLIHTKNKYSKMYKEKYLHTMASYDFLMYSPTTDESIDDDYIKILLPGHAEYKETPKRDS